MRETNKGLLTSLVVHVSIIPLLFGLFTGLHDKTTHAVAIDFTLSSNGTDQANGPAGPKDGTHKKLQAAPPAKSIEAGNRKNALTRQTAVVSPASEKTSSLVSQQKVILSDPQSSTIIHGQSSTSGRPDTERHTYGESADTSSGQSGTGGTGGGQIDNRQGSGSDNNPLMSSGKDYSYIRDAVMKNIRYPEKARRMGFEGKAVLSFIVLENGTTSDIKVVMSSGYKLLDESAREAVAETHILKKVPYRVLVHLPIAYTLKTS